METTCPQCNQRLRVRDELHDPLLRCGRCGNVFRLADGLPEALPTSAGGFPSTRLSDLPRDKLPNEVDHPDEEVPNEELSVEDSPQEESPVIVRRERVKDRNSPAQKGGWGSVVVIVLFLLLKTGPRLINNVIRERQVPPAPVRVNDADARDVQRMLHQLEQQVERDKAAAQPEIPQLDHRPPVELAPPPPIPK